MEDKIIKILQSVKAIEPDAEFVKRSRALILTLPKHNRIKTGILDTFKFGFAMTFAAILMFILVGGLSYFKITNLSPAVLTSFDEQSLQTEAGNLDFKIQLGEAKYFDDSAEQVAAVLKEISKPENSDIDQLIKDIILNRI